MAISKSESTKKVKLNLKGLNSEEKELAKITAGQILVESINEFLDRSESPVQGGKFKEKKIDGTSSQLFEFGDMRSQITFEELESDHIEVGIFSDAPEVERLKSFNHNTGDTLPKRQFIAAPNKRFKKEIMDEIDRSLDEIREDAKARKEDEDLIVQTILEPEDILGLLDG